MGSIRARVIVAGEVQKVGYRDFVQRVAKGLSVKGFVENLRDGTVQIVCEAESEVLDEFLKKIRVKEDFIDVESVEVVETSTATGEFKYFDLKYGRIEEELGDRMVMAVNFAKATREDIGEMRTDIKEMRTDVKEMRSSIEGVRSEIHEMRTDMNRSFAEMAERYDAISSTLSEAVNTMKAELLKTREDLTRAVDNLSKLVQEFITERHKN